MKKRKLTALTIVILVVLLAFSACTISSQPAGSESSSPRRKARPRGANQRGAAPARKCLSENTTRPSRW